MNSSKEKLIGIFGGSFDPPHIGHLKIANNSIKKVKLDNLYWVVTKKNPFKPKALFNIKERLRLCKKLTKKNKKIKVKFFDHITKSSRIIKVIKYLKRKHKNSKFFLIIGSDSLINFHRWELSKKIVKMTTLVIYPRSGFENKAKNSIISRELNKENSIFLKSSKVNISSSKLRKNYLR